MSKNADALTGVCPVCGPVGIVPFGRGYACAVRAGELRSVVQAAPNARCFGCRKWDRGTNRVVDGYCGWCRNWLRWVWTVNLDGYVPRPGASRPPPVVDRNELNVAGWHAFRPEEEDPYRVDDFQPVRGWKTIGSPAVPGKRRLSA